MKLRISILFSLLIMFVSCQDTSQYTLTGTFEGKKQHEFNGKKVTAFVYDGTNKVELDSAVVEDNIFKIKGQVSKNTIANLSFEGLDKKTFIFVKEKGEIKITIGDDGATLFGTPMNTALQNLRVGIQNQNLTKEKLHTTLQKLEAAKRLELNRFKSIDSDLSKADGEISKLTLKFLEDNHNTPLAEYALIEYANLLAPEKVQEQIGKISSPQNVEGMDKLKSRTESRINVAIDKQFTDIVGEDIKGSKIALSDVVGKSKVLLVDFWASWCPPCRASIPSLKELQKKYKDLEIVGVTIDKDKNAWLEVSKNEKVDWKQIATFNPTEISSTYAFNSIPYIVLLDKKGVIRKSGNIDKLSLEYYIKELLEEK